jgi:hypothetical protein
MKQMREGEGTRVSAAGLHGRPGVDEGEGAGDQATGLPG